MGLKELAGIFKVKTDKAATLLAAFDLSSPDACVAHHMALTAILGDCIGAFNRVILAQLSRNVCVEEEFRLHFSTVNTITKTLSMSSERERCRWAQICVEKYMRGAGPGDREGLSKMAEALHAAKSSGGSGVNKARSEPKYWN